MKKPLTGSVKTAATGFFYLFLLSKKKKDWLMLAVLETNKKKTITQATNSSQWNKRGKNKRKI